MEKKLLIVDDEKMIRDVLNRAFQREGYTVALAESAEDAIDLLKIEKIMVMFLDLKLPVMNGIDLCRYIRKDNATAIIYALTGYASMFELSDCRDAGFDDYFSKPVDLDVLFKAAEDAFSKISRWKM